MAVNLANHVGFIILAHHNLHRVAQLALHLSRHGGKVIIHIDAHCPKAEFDKMVRSVSLDPGVLLSDRVRCSWGTFSLTEAVLVAARQLLQACPEVDQICHLSGDTLPLRPVAEFLDHIKKYVGVDMIESFSAQDDNWIIDGLGVERFKYWFPFVWRQQRRMFDYSVQLQRKLRVSRRMPIGLEPFVGSQWWCLTRKTMDAILNDPCRKEYDRFFRWCWIPDESYFQTLARKHSSRIESRSFVLSRFDASGRPHVFYDDHIEMLTQSGAYFARKIWPGADKLYHKFLGDGLVASAEDTGKLDRAVKMAESRRKNGRKGLIMQGRFPAAWAEDSERTAGPYLVFCGFEHVVPGFVPWLGTKTKSTIHGRLFSRGQVAFGGGAEIGPGCLPAATAIRDSDPAQFLRNLLWTQRGRNHCFLFDPADNPALADFIAKDRNAHVYVLTGSWAAQAYLTGTSAAAIKPTAMRQQAAEKRFLNVLASKKTMAQVSYWSFLEFLAEPSKGLRSLMEACQQKFAPGPFEMPGIRQFDGLDAFLADLRNLGMIVPEPERRPASQEDRVRRGAAGAHS